MAAITSGIGLGLYHGSLTPQAGQHAQLGSNGNRVYVNSTTGNLVIQQQDEFLSSLGLDLGLVRTYNSQGQFDDDNGDNWRLNVNQRLHSLTGTVNTAGSTITKVFGDGFESVYTYDVGLSLYVSTDGDGPHDTLSYNATTSEWTWTDGTPNVTEVYDVNGQLLRTQDSDGNAITYTYTGNLITQITDASGQLTEFIYAGNNLAEIRVVTTQYLVKSDDTWARIANQRYGTEDLADELQTLYGDAALVSGNTLTSLPTTLTDIQTSTPHDLIKPIRTRYSYDAQDRLSQVTVDLSPDDGKIVDGITYVTTYTYDGSSTRIASITGGDGTTSAFTYDAEGRIATVTDGAGQVTRMQYSPGIEHATAALDPSVLTVPTEPPWSGPVGIDELLTTIRPLDPQTAFDANGNGFAVWRQNDGSTNSLYGSRYETGVGWGAVDLVDTNVNQAYDPRIDLDAQGNATVVWYAANESIHANQYIVGQGWTGPVVIGTGNTSNWATLVQIDVADSGHAVAIWAEGPFASDYDVYANRYIPGQGWSGPENIELLAGATASPIAKIDEQGNIIAVWRHHNGTDYQLHSNQYRVGQGWGTAMLIDTAPGVASYPPELALDAQGNGMLVWGKQDPALNFQSQAYALWYDATLGWETTPTLLAIEVGSPKVVMLPDSTAMVAWSGSNGIEVNTYTAGSGWGIAEQVTTSSGVLNLGVDGNGVAWVSWWGNYYFHVSNKKPGEAWSPVESLKTLNYRTEDADFTVGQNGTAAATWVQYDASGLYYRVYANVRDVNGPTTPYYLVQSGDTWASIAGAAYGIDAAKQEEAGAALQVVLGLSTLNAGDHLDLPETLTYTAILPTVRTDVSASHLDDQGRVIATENLDGTVTAYRYDTQGRISDVKTYTAPSTTTTPQWLWQQDFSVDSSGFVQLYPGYTDVVNGQLEIHNVNQASTASGSIFGARTHTIEQSLTFRTEVTTSAFADSRDVIVGLVGDKGTWPYQQHTLQLKGDRLISQYAELAGSIKQSQTHTPLLKNSTTYVFEQIVGKTGTTIYFYEKGQMRDSGIIDHRDSKNWQTAQLIITLKAGPDVTPNTTRFDNFSEAVGSPVADLYVQPSATDSRIQYLYDSQGRVGATRDAQGQVTTYQYDANDQLTGLRQHTQLPTPAIWEQNFSVVSDGLTFRGDPMPIVNGQLAVSSINQATSLWPAAYRTDTHAFSEQVTYQADITMGASSVGRNFNIGIDDNTGRHAIEIRDNIVSLTTDNGPTFSRYELGLVTDNTTYTFELETHASGTTLYLYEKGQPRDSGYVDTFNYTDWGDAKLWVWTYAGPTAVNNTVYVDNMLEIPQYDHFIDGYAIVDDAADVVLPVGNQTTTITDAKGNITSYTTDIDGRLTAVQTPAIDSSRNTSQYQYDSDGNLSAISDANGNVTEQGFNPDGTLAWQQDAEGNRREYAYDANGLLVNDIVYRTEDPDGIAGPLSATDPVVTRYVYDSENHIRFTVSAEGRISEQRYNAAGQRIASLVYTADVYDISALLETDSLSETELATWVAGLIDKTNALRSDYSYDFRGNLASTTTYASLDATGAGLLDGKQSTTQFIYDQAGQLLQSIDAKGVASTGDLTDGITQFTYDGLGRVLTSTDALGRITTNNYDDVNNRVATTLANGLTTTHVYDARGLLVSTSQSATDATPLGTTSYIYDERGQLKYSQDPLGRRSHILYDEAGRTIASIDNSGALSETVYDQNNNIIQVISYGQALSDTTLSKLVNEALPLDYLRNEASNAEERSVYTLYDKANRPVMVITTSDTDPNVGYVSQNFYDGAGQITDVIQYANDVDISTLDANSLPDDLVITADAVNDRHSRSFYSDDGLVQGTLDAEGHVTETVYDKAGRAIETIAYANPLTDTALHSSGDFAAIKTAIGIHANDRHAYSLYNGRGQVAGSIDADGYLTETTYDLNGNVTEVTRYYTALIDYTYTLGQTMADVRPQLSNSDRIIVTTYTALNQVETVTEIRNEYTSRNEYYETTRYDYDDVGNLVATTRGLNTNDIRTVRVRYDAVGRVIGELTPQGSEQLELLLQGVYTQVDIDNLWATYGVRHEYDSAGRRLSTTDQNGHTRLFYYDAAGRLSVTIQNADGGLDETGQLITNQGEVTRSTYNTFGQVVDTTVYANRIDTIGLVGGDETDISLQLDALGDAINDSSTKVNYTLRGAVKQAIDAMGYRTENTYTTFGELETTTQQHTLPVGDNVNPLTTGVSGDSLVSRFVYDRRGQQTEAYQDTAGLNRHTQTQYDAFGRVTQSVDGNGITTTYSYGTSTEPYTTGRQIVTMTRAGLSTVTTYDAFGRTLQVQDANNKITSYEYDDFSRSLSISTAKGIKTTTTLNTYGETIRVSGGGTVTQYVYDKNGNLSTVTEAFGTADEMVTKNFYDNADRLVQTEDANGVITVFKYDAANRVLERNVDPFGLNITTKTQYDAKSQVLYTTDANGVITETRYDNNGQVTDIIVDPYDAVTNPDGLNIITHYSYDGRGKLLSLSEGYGTPEVRTTQYIYDTLGRRSQEILDPEGLNIITEYVYDMNDNVISKTEALNTFEARTTRYVYDDSDRLTFTVDALGAVIHNSYDNNGNVISTWQYATTLTDVKLGELDAAIDRNTYIDSLTPGLIDLMQDRITRFVYDADNRLNYTVDALGYVIQQRLDSKGQVIKTIHYAEALNADAVLNFAGLDPTIMTDVEKQTQLATVLSTGNIQAGINLSSANNRHSYYIYDARGQVRYLVDAAGHVREFSYDKLGQTKRLHVHAGAIDTALFGSYPDGTAVQSALAARTVTLTEKDQITDYDYDTAGRQIGVTKAVGSVDQFNESITYDAVGQVTSKTNGRGDTHYYRYDNAGRNTRSIDAMGYAIDYDHYATGEVKTKTTYMNAVALPVTADPLWAYHALDPSANTDAVSGDRVVTYLYDARGKVLEEQVQVDIETIDITTVTKAEWQATELLLTDTPTLMLQEVYSNSPGSAIAVFMSNDGLDNHLWIKRRVEGVWQAEEHIANLGANSATAQAHIDATGNAVVIWQNNVEGGGVHSLWANRFIDGVWQGVEPLEVDDVNPTASAHLMVSDLGEGLVVWEQSDGVQTSIWANRLSEGLWLGAEKIEVYDSGSATAPQVSVDELGNAVVVWQQYDGVRNNIWTNRLVDGLWQGAESLEVEGGDAQSPNVSLDNQGNAVAVWKQHDGVRYNLWANRLVDGIWQGAEQIRLNGGLDTEPPLIKIDEQGNAVAVWIESGTVFNSIWANRLVNGLWQGAEMIESADSGPVSSLQFDITAEGDAVALWQLNDGVDDHIWANRLVDGAWQGEELLHSGGITPQLSIDLVGNITALWHETVDGAQHLSARQLFTSHEMVYTQATKNEIKTVYQYDTYGNLTQTTQAQGFLEQRTIQREYDVLGRIISESFGFGTAEAATSHFEYDTFGNQTQIIDPRSVELISQDTDFALAERERLGITIIDAESSQTRAKYTAELSTADIEVLEAVYATAQEFDRLNRKTAASDALGGRTQTEYDAFGNIVKVTDPNGHSGYYYTDELNRTVIQVDPEGYVTRMLHDAFGNVLETIVYANRVVGSYDQNTSITFLTTEPVGTPPPAYVLIDTVKDRYTIAEYDALNRTHLITDADNNTESFDYDATDNVRFHVDKNNNSHEYNYDAVGNKTEEYSPPVDVVLDAQSGAMQNNVRILTKHTYDARGNRTSTTEAANLAGLEATTTYVYDKRDLQVAVISPPVTVYNEITQQNTSQQPKTESVYDGIGNRVESIDANGNRTVYYYDSQNRNIASVDASGVLQTIEYDQVGNKITTRTFGDAVSLPVDRFFIPQIVDAGNVREQFFIYDAKNQLVGTRTPPITVYSVDQGILVNVEVETQQIYDHNGNVIQSIDGRGNITTYYYDKAGHRIAMLSPRDDITAMVWDDVSHKYLPQTVQGSYMTEWIYDAYGNVTKEIRYASPTTDVIDPAVLPQPNLHTDDRVKSYVYDGLNRVLEERTHDVSHATTDAATGFLSEGVADAVTTYGYDGLGNVKHVIRAGGSGQTDFTYDALGRQTMVQRPEFTEFENARVRSTTSFAFDAYGNQALVTQHGKIAADDQVSRYHYEAMARLVKEIDAEGAVIQYDYDANGNARFKHETRTDAQGLTSPIATEYRYDTLNRQTHRIDAEGDSHDTRYTAWGDVESKGLNGGEQEWYYYDKVGRIWMTNANEGSPRAYLYDENGNGTLELHASELDMKGLNLDQVLEQLGGSVRAFVNIYDARNQQIKQFEPPMTYSSPRGSVIDEGGNVQTGVEVIDNSRWIPQNPYTGGSIVVDRGGSVTARVNTYSVKKKTRGGVAAHLFYYMKTVEGGISSITLNIPKMNGYGDGDYRVKVALSTPRYTTSVRVRRGPGPSAYTTIYHEPVTTVFWGSLSTHLGSTTLPGSIFNGYSLVRTQNIVSNFTYTVTVYKKTLNGDKYVGTASGDFPSFHLSDRDNYSYTTHHNGTYSGSGSAVKTFHLKSQDQNATEIRFRHAPAGTENYGSWYTYSGGTIKKHLNGHFYIEGQTFANRNYEYEVYVGSELVNHVKGYIPASGAPTHYNQAPPDVWFEDIQSNPIFEYIQDLKYYISDGLLVDNVIERGVTYNAFGETVAETDGNGNISVMSYNTLGNLIKKEDPETSITHENGFMERIRPTYHYYYDLLGQLAGTQNSNGQLTADPNDFRVTQVVESGRVIKEFHPDGGNVAFAYDIFGNLRKQKDEIDRITYNTYDKKNRLVHVDRFETEALYQTDVGGNNRYVYDYYEYDEVGNRLAHTNTLGDRESYSYDGVNRIISHTSYAGRTTGYSYTYDASIGGIGGYQKVTDLSFGRAAIGAVDYKLRDDLDYFNRLHYHEDQGGHSFNYFYNTAGWLKQQTGSTGQDIVFDYYHNGYKKSVIDYGVDAYVYYEYDKNGNRIFEGYAEASVLTPEGLPAAYEPYQFSEAKYDELNRLIEVLDPKYQINYEYDAVGNRRRVKSYYHDGVDGNQKNQEFWYKYDAMNRFVLTMGEFSHFDVNGDPIRGTSRSDTSRYIQRGSGFDIQYNAAGQRVEAISNTGHEVYTYTPAGHLKDTTIDGVLAAHRENDAFGNVKEYLDYQADGVTVLSHHVYSYDKDSNMTFDQAVVGDSDDVDYTLDTAGMVEQAVTTAHSGNSVITTKYVYEYWDTAKQDDIKITGYNDQITWSNDWKPGFSDFKYDVNGHIKQVTDYGSDYIPGTADDRILDYVSEHEGRILRSNEYIGGTVTSKTHNFYFIDGKPIGDVGEFGPLYRDYATLMAQLRDPDYTESKNVVSADFDQNYIPINPNYPSRTPGSYTARDGDSFNSIALQLWGDSSLWYILADANGMAGTDPIPAGMNLVVPNIVTNIHNNADTYRPYQAGLAMGSTSPYLPAPPPPPFIGEVSHSSEMLKNIELMKQVKKAGLIDAAEADEHIAEMQRNYEALLDQERSGKCGIAQIIVAAITVVVSIYVPAMMGLAKTWLGAVIGAAAGSVAGQLAGMGLGIQDKFSWRSVAVSAISAGATQGITPSGTGIVNQMVTAGVRSSVGQMVSIIIGEQQKFNWQSVAAAAIAAPVTARIGHNGATNSGKAMDTAATWEGFGNDLAVNFAKGATKELIRMAVSGDNSFQWASVTGDALGTAIGDAMVTQTRYSQYRAKLNAEIETQKQQLRDLGIPFVPRADGGVQVLNNELQRNNLALQNQRTVKDWEQYDEDKFFNEHGLNPSVRFGPAEIQEVNKLEKINGNVKNIQNGKVLNVNPVLASDISNKLKYMIDKYYSDNGGYLPEDVSISKEKRFKHTMKLINEFDFKDNELEVINKLTEIANTDFLREPGGLMDNYFQDGTPFMIIDKNTSDSSITNSLSYSAQRYARKTGELDYILGLNETIGSQRGYVVNTTNLRTAEVNDFYKLFESKDYIEFADLSNLDRVELAAKNASGISTLTNDSFDILLPRDLPVDLNNSFKSVEEAAAGGLIRDLAVRKIPNPTRPDPKNYNSVIIDRGYSKGVDVTVKGGIQHVLYPDIPLQFRTYENIPQNELLIY